MLAQLLAPLLALVCTPDSVSVSAVDSDGNAVEKAKVEVHVGRVRLDLAESYDRWISLDTLEGQTDAEGRAVFEAVDEHARVTVVASTTGLYGIASGTPGDVTVELLPTGQLEGKVRGKKRELKRVQVEIVGPSGFFTATTGVDSRGKFDVARVPPGELAVRLVAGRWLSSEASTKLKPGAKGKAPALKATGDFLTGANPLVDVTKVRLVNEKGDAVSGVTFAFSNPTMDGWTSTDDKGEILLVGGSISLGPPPFALALDHVGFDQDTRYLGELVSVKRDLATVRIGNPLVDVKCRVTVGGRSQGQFALRAVTQWDLEPRVWEPFKEQNQLSLPTGPARVFVATIDGRLTEHAIEIPATGPIEHTFEIDP